MNKCFKRIRTGKTYIYFFEMEYEKLARWIFANTFMKKENIDFGACGVDLATFDRPVISIQITYK